MSLPNTVLIMAAGTGGHVFPALSIAHALQAKSANIEWLGTPNGLENELLASSNIPLHHITVSGLVGSGIKRKLLAPFMILNAFLQSLRLLRKIKPDCVLGMGGFVCGPAGVAAKLTGLPLVLHEQNAVAGLTNKLLARIADRVLEAFPNTFKASPSVFYTGNPLRREIAALQSQPRAVKKESDVLKVLVLGGSLGALAINDVMPAALKRCGGDSLSIIHQAGKDKVERTVAAYSKEDFSESSQLTVTSFIADMAKAYAWCDLVICRSGASTVSEIAAAGKPSILIPYPYHRDNQQAVNAAWLENAGAASVISQQELSPERLSNEITKIREASKLEKMGSMARAIAVLDADTVIADHCLELANA